MELDAILAQADTNQATKRVPVTFDAKGDPESGFIIVSRESEQFRAESKRQRIAGVRRGAVKKSQIDTKTEAGAEQLVDLIDENELGIARAVVVDWFGFTRGDKPAKFDRATADAVLAKKHGWRAAVIAALDDENGFLSAQPAS